MDQITIGKFIAACRKEQGLTQAQLAEQLGVSDRAVSKWETGRSLPDASLMLPLCGILRMDLNELFCGRRIDMENYKEIAEQNLLEMKRREEQYNKRLLHAMYVFGFTGIAASLALMLGGAYVADAGQTTIGIVLISLGVVVLIPTIGYSMILEHAAGYYECKECGERFTVGIWKMTFAPHVGTTRYLRCPHCHKLGWDKKVLTKEKTAD